MEALFGGKKETERRVRTFDTCSSCRATIETFDDVVACPHCGYDNRPAVSEEEADEERVFDLVDLFVAMGFVPALAV